MNNLLLKISLFLFSFSLFTSCDKLREKEINLSLNEVLVYYDDETDSFKVLENGKHTFATNYSYSKFSLEDLEIKERMKVLTNDEQEVTIGLTYWYAMNRERVIQIHENYVGQIEEILILPNVRTAVRDVFNNIVSDSLNSEKIRHELLTNINNLNDYSELINSKSFIITELNLVQK